MKANQLLIYVSSASIYTRKEILLHLCQQIKRRIHPISPDSDEKKSRGNLFTFSGRLTFPYFAFLSSERRLQREHLPPTFLRGRTQRCGQVLPGVFFQTLVVVMCMFVVPQQPLALVEVYKLQRTLLVPHNFGFENACTLPHRN